MSDIEDIGTALALTIKAVFELDKRLKALEADNVQSCCGAAAKANDCPGPALERHRRCCQKGIR